MITITYKAGKHLIYDSILEKITVFPPVTLVGDFYEKNLKNNLQVR